MSKIRFSVSNLFVIMNMNYFKKFDKVVFSVWRSFNYGDYQKYSDLANKKEPEIIPKNLSTTKQLEAFQVKYKFDIKEDIKKCQSSKTSAGVVKKKAEILESLPKKIKKEDLKEITKLVNDTSNTVYGTKNENNAVIAFEKTHKCKVSSSQACSEITINDGTIVIVGKIDGLTEKGEVVEIKNRVNKHFNTIRGYEKPQIMTYLWMNKASSGYLVENLKTNGGCNLNVIPVEYEDNYVEENVIPNLTRFHKFFMDFMCNDEWKMDLIKGEEAKIYNIFMKKY